MTNTLGRVAVVITDRSWKVPLKFAPVEVNSVPTIAAPSGASTSSSLNWSSSARTPDHSRCARRSVMTSKTASGGAADVTDVCVRNENDCCDIARPGYPKASTDVKSSGARWQDAPMDRVPDAPTADLLLDVWTPGELALSPDGSRMAFALHATVADERSFQPSHLYVIGTEPGAKPVQLTRGNRCDQTPVWSPDGSRLAFCSDRITPGHHLPYTMPGDGGEPSLAADLVGSAESIAWSSD